MTLHPISGKSYLLPLLLVCASLCTAQTAVPVVLAPLPQLQFFDQSGRPLSFGCVFSYQSQTTTPLATFTDFTGQFQNPNPVILSAGGSANIWLQSGQAYSLTVKSSGGTNCSLGQTLYTVDGVGGGASQLNTVVTPSGGSATFTVQSQNQLFSLTLTGNVAGSLVSFIGVIAPALVTFQITEDGGGNHTFTWPSNVTGAAPIDTAANQMTSQTFIWNGTAIMPVGSGFSSNGSGIFQGIATLSNLNNVVFIDPKTSDIGAAINAAYASLPANGGTIIYGPNATGTCYSTSTPIVMATPGKVPLLWQWGSSRITSTGVAGTCISYGPTTASTAITLDYVATTDSNAPKAHGLRGVTLANGCIVNPGCGSLATGIAIGTTNAGAINAIMEDVSVVGFGTGFLNNNPLSPNIDWINPFFQANNIAMKHGTLQEKFFGGFFIANGCVEQAVSTTTPELYFANSEFTENTGGTCAAAFDFSNAGNSSNLSLSNVHIENSPGQNGHEVAGILHVSIMGGIMEDDTSTGTGDWMVSLGTGQSQLDMSGTNIISARAYTNVFLMSTNSRATVLATDGSPTTLTCSTFFGGAGAANVNSLITPLGTGNPLCNFSFQAPLAFTVGKGIGADGSGFKHHRFGATCTTAASVGASCTTTFSWTTAFADVSYTPVCTGVGPANGPALAIDSFNTTGITIRVYSFVALASGYNGVDCTAVHD